MRVNKGNSALAAIMHWAARVCGIAVAGFVIVFFIGEGNISQMMRVSALEIAMLACIPLLLVVGIIVAWKKELIGGIIIMASVLAFIVLQVISSGYFSGLMIFASMMIPGLLFIISDYLSKMEQRGDYHALSH